MVPTIPISTSGRIGQEFLAADARHQVEIAHMARQAVGEFLQHHVTGGMAIGVVDLLEVIDIEHQHGEDLFLLARARDQPLQMPHDIAAVEQAGQRVGQRHRQAGGIVGDQPVLIALLADLAAHARQQFVPVDRAQDIVVGAELQPLGDPLHFLLVGQQQDGGLPRALARAQVGAEPKPVFLRQQQADHDQVIAAQGSSISAIASAYSP